MGDGVSFACVNDNHIGDLALIRRFARSAGVALLAVLLAPLSTVAAGYPDRPVKCFGKVIAAETANWAKGVIFSAAKVE